MRIERKFYLDQIRKFMLNGLVKVITGIRRCGKSYFLFNIFRDYLREAGVADEQIIEVRLDEDEFEFLRNPRALSLYVKERLLSDGRQMYVLIDEIQECKPLEGDGVTFYDVLTTLMKKADIYVTGSNSEMLSEDIATNFRDRGDSPVATFVCGVLPDWRKGKVRCVGGLSCLGRDAIGGFVARPAFA